MNSSRHEDKQKICNNLKKKKKKGILFHRSLLWLVAFSIAIFIMKNNFHDSMYCACVNIASVPTTT